ncbi:hypothetical protein IG631_01009 [Alternaria alternata]|nr:hypothetical protein IG631_01009 [Alternaria alternata]
MSHMQSVQGNGLPLMPSVRPFRAKTRKAPRLRQMNCFQSRAHCTDRPCVIVSMRDACHTRRRVGFRGGKHPGIWLAAASIPWSRRLWIVERPAWFARRALVRPG